MKHISILSALWLLALGAASQMPADTVAYHTDSAPTPYDVASCGSTTWGIRLPAELIPQHRQLHEVQFYAGDSGDYRLTVYTGHQPDHVVYSEYYTFDTAGWQTIAFDYSIPVYDTAPLWITLSSSGICTPTHFSAYCGNPDGSWLFDGTDWHSDATLGSWLLRVIFTEAEKVSLTLRVVNGYCGYATGGGLYYPGDTATIEAIPSERNCQFVSWSDGSTDNPYSFVIEANLVISAHFEETSGIDDIVTDGLTYALRGLDLEIDNPQRHPVLLHDITGRRLAAADTDALRVTLPAAGIYILHVPGFPARRIVATR